jgi:hypothetical protein
MVSAKRSSLALGNTPYALNECTRAGVPDHDHNPRGRCALSPFPEDAVPEDEDVIYSLFVREIASLTTPLAYQAEPVARIPPGNFDGNYRAQAGSCFLFTFLQTGACAYSSV